MQHQSVSMLTPPRDTSSNCCGHKTTKQRNSKVIGPCNASRNGHAGNWYHPATLVLLLLQYRAYITSCVRRSTIHTCGSFGLKKGPKKQSQPNPTQPCWYTMLRCDIPWLVYLVLQTSATAVSALFFNVMERLSAQSGVLTTRPRFSPFRVPSRGLLGDCCVRQELKSAVSPGLFAYIPEYIFNIIIFYFPAQLVPYHTCHFCVMFLAGGLTVGGLLRGYSFPTRCRTTNLNERIIRTTKTMHAALVPCILSSRSFSYFLPPHPPLPPPAPPNLKGAMA